MKLTSKICLALAAAFTLVAATPAQSQTTNTPPAAAKPHGKRYMGTVSSVDATASTITISPTKAGDAQTLKVTSSTHIRKAHEAATLADITAGLKVSGTMHKDDASGDWVANTVNIMVAKTSTNAPPSTK